MNHSSSARGKEYRAKRRKYERELDLDVYKLGAHIAKLECQLSRTPYAGWGPLTKTLREYFKLFRYGLYENPTIVSAKGIQTTSDIISNRVQHQEQFLHAIMDENAMVSGKYGPNASLDQWRLYTLSQNLLRVELQRVETTYSGDIPILTVHTLSHFRFGRTTMQFMFPGAVSDVVLMSKFLNREVAYKGVFRYIFTDHGLISSESVEFGFVEAFLEAGCSLSDVAALMKYCVLSSSYAIPSEFLSKQAKLTSQSREKLSLNYLLS